MTTFDYLSYRPEYTTLELKATLKTVLSTDAVSGEVDGIHYDINDGITRKIMFGELVRKIDNNNLLDLIIRYFKIHQLLKTESQILTLINNSLIPDDKKTLVKSYVYGTVFEYESQIIYNLPILDLNNLPTLKFEITSSQIIHNLFQVLNKIQRIRLSMQSDYVEKTNTVENQKKYYSSLIKFFTNYDYVRQTEYFQEEVKFLKNRKEGLFLPEFNTQNLTNPNSRIFKTAKAFNLFNAYRSSIVKNEHTEFSYIFRKMKSENLIYNDITDFAYREWLFNEYGKTIDKTKQLSAMGVDKKDRLFHVLKDQFLK